MTWATAEGPTARVAWGRVLGIDLGSRRIGVAVSDDARHVASALSVLARGGSRAEDHAGLVGIVAETGANLVVVGLPLSLNGRVGPAAAAVQAEVEELRLVLDVPVECADERYTTVVAHQGLTASSAGRRPAAARRAVVDKVAAAAILQTWLDRQRASARPEPAGTGNQWRAGTEPAGTEPPGTGNQWRGEANAARRLPRRAH